MQHFITLWVFVICVLVGAENGALRLAQTFSLEVRMYSKGNTVLCLSLAVGLLVLCHRENAVFEA